MSNKTSKSAYRKHSYSGPRKSSKKIRAGLKKYNIDSRVKAWRSKETKKKPANEEVVTVGTQNKQLRTYPHAKPKIRLEATYSTYSTSISTGTADPVVGQSSFVQVPQNESEIEMLVVKLEPPEYYEQYTEGESSTTAAASSICLTEELHDRIKAWRSKETKKKPANEEVVTGTQNKQLRTYPRAKPKIRLEATYSTSISTGTADPVVGQSSFVQVAQNESEVEMLVVKLEPPEYYEQYTEGESSTTAAASSICLSEELHESGLFGESEIKVEKIEIGEEGFS